MKSSHNTNITRPPSSGVEWAFRELGKSRAVVHGVPSMGPGYYRTLLELDFAMAMGLTSLWNHVDYVYPLGQHARSICIQFKDQKTRDVFLKRKQKLWDEFRYVADVYLSPMQHRERQRLRSFRVQLRDEGNDAFFIYERLYTKRAPGNLVRHRLDAACADSSLPTHCNSGPQPPPDFCPTFTESQDEDVSATSEAMAVVSDEKPSDSASDRESMLQDNQSAVGDPCDYSAAADDEFVVEDCMTSSPSSTSAATPLASSASSVSNTTTPSASGMEPGEQPECSDRTEPADSVSTWWSPFQKRARSVSNSDSGSSDSTAGGVVPLSTSISSFVKRFRSKDEPPDVPPAFSDWLRLF